MPDYLYRFRSIRALIDSHHELENDELFFCPPGDLNDPLEGFKDIFWRGDEIVWRNLLKHYLLFLMQAASIAAISGREFSIGMCSNLAYNTSDDLPKTPIRDIYSTICTEFFSSDAPDSLISMLGSQSRAARRDELIFYLRSLHPLAIAKVFLVFGQHGLPPFQQTSAIETMVDGASRNMLDIVKALMQPDDIPDELFAASENMHHQLGLINLFNNKDNANAQWFFSIYSDLPGYYVNSLEQLIYPDWYTACFSANPTNASMWGTYGNSHQGVCLKFKTRKGDQGIPTLDIYRAIGWGGSKGNITTHYGYTPHRFEKIRYTSEFPEIDFFQSLGRLPRYKLTGFWYVGGDGTHSSTASRILSESEDWRAEYWRNFVTASSTKSSEWAHEEEHRLIMHSNLDSLDDPGKRKCKYRFNDLTGIIFGIKTSQEDKIRIMQIVSDKCERESRKEFEFYQAHYSRRTRKIELARLDLIRPV